MIISAVLAFFSLPLISVSLLLSQHIPLEFNLPGTLCFLDLSNCFLPHVREVFSHYFLQRFPQVLSLGPL